MKNDTLLYFKNPDDFLRFLYELDIYNEWKIQSGLLNRRGSKISGKRYVNTLRNVFNERNFFRQQVSIAEIVSWLDTMALIKRLLISLQSHLSRDEYLGIEIHIEYMIQMSKKMRIDYIFVYRDTILLIEFRTVSKFEKIRPTWQMKFNELLVYKELMSYYIINKQIVIYAFISLYEYEENNLISKHRQYNDNQVAYLTEYIKRYLINKK